MKRIGRWLSAMALSMVVTFVLFAATTPVRAAPAEWQVPSDAAIHDLLERRIGANTVGIVIGIIEPAGQRVITYGTSGARNRRPLDGDTVFQIGSVTKVFTSLLLADMVQKGEVGIDDPVQQYLPPGIRMPQNGRAVTLLDLSKHLSGLPSMPTNFSLAARPDPYSAYTAMQLHEFLSTFPLPREPGRQAYSNFGAALLGRVLAREAGLPYEQLLSQRVLQPLALSSTSILVSAEQEKRLAPGHDRFLRPVDSWNLTAMPASGALRSTVNDLLRFLSFNLGYQQSALADAMAYQRVPGKALGWGASRPLGRTVYGHDGGKEGYRSAIVFDMVARTGIVILTNARTDDRPIALARHLLVGEPLPAAAQAAVLPAIVPLSAKNLQRLEGEYRLESGGTIRVARHGAKLWVDLVGDGVLVFESAGDGEFFSNIDDMRINFDLSPPGPASQLSLHSGSDVELAARID